MDLTEKKPMGGAAHDTDRFNFGENWRRFLGAVDEQKIDATRELLARMFDTDNLDGRTFLDVGCGSGLHSLAARRMGARVHSFDYDPQSVACAKELRRRYAPDDEGWTVETGSILDDEFLAGLGQYNVVYSWGVLHHTGAMWKALENTVQLVAPGGLLYIAIYNDQGRASRWWRGIKRMYNRSPAGFRWMLIGGVRAYFFSRTCVGRVLQGQLPFQVRGLRANRYRGMSAWYDLIDWVGGYPFEVAKPEQVFYFLRDHGFELRKLVTCGGGLGCNEYVAVRK